MIGSANTPGAQYDGPGMTQAETEDLLARIAVLQAKVTGLSARLRRFEQAARGQDGDRPVPRPRHDWAVITGVPHAAAPGWN
jgi:hypothetical protein